jgi:hypothetical protein
MTEQRNPVGQPPIDSSTARLTGVALIIFGISAGIYVISQRLSNPVVLISCLPLTSLGISLFAKRKFLSWQHMFAIAIPFVVIIGFILLVGLLLGLACAQGSCV